MHDGKLEDRLRTVLRGEGDTLPMTITTAELERRLALRRRERLGRRASVLAAAVVVVAVGSLVATTGGWFRSTSVGSGPSPAPTASSAPSEAALPCETIDPATTDEPPALIFGVTPGDAIGYGGVQGAYRLGDREVGDPREWGVPGPAALDPIAVGLQTGRFQVLASEPDACLIGLVAEAKQIAPTPAGRIDPSTINLGATRTEPTRFIEFAQPPAGQWIVRVRVDFDTGGRGEAWSQAWIGVLVQDPSASPSDLPGVLPELTAPEGVILFDESSPIDAPGEPTGVVEVIGLAPVPPRSVYQVDVTCLGSGPIRWSLGLEGEFGFMAAGDQACDGTVGSHTLELGIPSGDVPIFVQADPATAWHVMVSSIAEQPAFSPPSLRGWWTAETGSSAAAAEAFGHCVSSAAGADHCGPNWDTAADARRIRVTSEFETTISFQLQDEWDVAQARVTAVAAGTTSPEYSVGFTDELNREIRVPMELEPGQWTLQVSLNAKRGTETFGASYNFLVEVAE